MLQHRKQLLGVYTVPGSCKRHFVLFYVTPRHMRERICCSAAQQQ